MIGNGATMSEQSGADLAAVRTKFSAHVQAELHGGGGGDSSRQGLRVGGSVMRYRRVFAMQMLTLVDLYGFGLNSKTCSLCVM